MPVFTKTANDVFAPQDSSGNPRGPSPQEAQVWGTEVERGFDNLDEKIDNTSQELGDRIDDLSDDVVAAAEGITVKPTWSELSAIAGTRDGQAGRVTGPDSGTHTDPVAGGTVNNIGEYAWDESSSGWERVGGAGLSVSTGASDAGKLIGTNDDGKLDYTFLPSNFPVLEEGLLFSVGDGLRGLFGVSDDGKGTLVGPWAAEISDLAHSPDARPKVYLAGDSRADQCSNDYQTAARGFLWWLQFMTGASFDFQLVQNYGVAGSETTDLVRQAIALADQEPGIVIAFTGTNDRTPSYTAEFSIMNYEAAEAVLTKAGHRVIWINDTPRGDGNSGTYSAGLSGGDLGYHMRCAQWLRERSKGKSVYCADTWPSMVNSTDATGRAIDTVFYDGLHPSPPGGYLIAKAILPILDHLVPRRSRLIVSNADLYGAANTSGSLIDNPLMTGTSGTVGSNCSGDLATGFSAVAGTGLTAALSKVTDADGVVWQQVAVSGTPSGSHDPGPPVDVDPVSCVISVDLDTSDVSEGDVIEAICEVEIDTGHTGLRGVPIYLVATASGVDSVVCGGEPETASTSFPNLPLPDPGSDLAGINITPQMTVPASLTALKFKVLVSARGSVAIDATVRFSRVSVRKVTTNG